jgi:hypothetical protein
MLPRGSGGLEAWRSELPLFGSALRGTAPEIRQADESTPAPLRGQAREWRVGAEPGSLLTARPISSNSSMIQRRLTRILTACPVQKDAVSQRPTSNSARCGHKYRRATASDVRSARRLKSLRGCVCWRGVNCAIMKRGQNDQGLGVECSANSGEQAPGFQGRCSRKPSRPSHDPTHLGRLQ